MDPAPPAAIGPLYGTGRTSSVAAPAATFIDTSRRGTPVPWADVRPSGRTRRPIVRGGRDGGQLIQVREARRRRRRPPGHVADQPDLAPPRRARRRPGAEDGQEGREEAWQGRQGEGGQGQGQGKGKGREGGPQGRRGRR